MKEHQVRTRFHADGILDFRPVGVTLVTVSRGPHVDDVVVVDGGNRQNLRLPLAGNDYLHGDYLKGPIYARSTDAGRLGGVDHLYGNYGQDQLFGGGSADILWGGQDKIFPAEYATAFKELIPRAQIAILNRCGHVPHMDRPDEFYPRLKSFLSEGPS